MLRKVNNLFLLIMACYCMVYSQELLHRYFASVNSAYAFQLGNYTRFQYGPGFDIGIKITKEQMLNIGIDHLFFDDGFDSLRIGRRIYLVCLQWQYTMANGQIGCGYVIAPNTFYRVESKPAASSYYKSNIGWAGIEFFISHKMELAVYSIDCKIFNSTSDSLNKDHVLGFFHVKASRILTRWLTLNCSADFGLFNDFYSLDYSYYNTNLYNPETGLRNVYILPNVEFSFKRYLFTIGPVFQLNLVRNETQHVSWQGSVGYEW
jgi:hypothetical protein